MNNSIKNLNSQKLQIQNRSELSNWQNIAVCDNYLIIKDNNIQIFEINLHNNSAIFLYEIKVKEELIKIISIDKNNIFFFFSVSIVKFDIPTKNIHPVQFCKLINDDKIIINTSDITSIYFNEKIKLSFDEKNYYFGLMTVGEDGELLISKEIIEDKETGQVEIVCESVRSFWKEVKHVELKVFYPKEKENSKGIFLITVITNNIGWYTEIKIPDVNDYHSLVDELRKTNWNILFDLSNSNVNNIFYSFYYDTNFGLPISFILLTDNLTMKYIEFAEKTDQDENLKYDNNKEILIIEKETDINFEQEIKNSNLDNRDRGLKIEYLVNTHHYGEIVYVSFKNRIFLYDLSAREILNFKKYESEYIRDIYIHDPSTKNDKKNFYNLYFLTNRNIYYSNIETNYQKEFYRTSLHSFNINDSKTMNEDLSVSRDFEDKRCVICKKLSTKRCSACKSVYYCNENHQEEDWPNHKKTCTWIDESQDNDNSENNKTSKIDMEECIFYTAQEWVKSRVEIMSLYKDRDKNPKNFTKGIDLCFNMIHKNKDLLSSINQNTIKALKTALTANGKEKEKEFFLRNIINLYKIYEDYICNILLLIHGFLLKDNKNEAWRVLNKLVKETEEKDFSKYIDAISEYTKNYIMRDMETPKTTKNIVSIEANLNQEMQSIFLRNLKLYATVAKVFYRIGEFSSYENYIINYIEKLERVYHNLPNGAYIIANAYLLMANLYVELDNLGKAIVLFNECLNLIGDPRDNKEFFDISIACNYNLGIVYFVTDQYYNSKLKLEQALKTKKDIKNQELTEQTAIIYETIGEIEIEYKNFSNAFTNLQKANEIRSKLPNVDDKKSKMKINILLDYIYQNLEKENETKFYKKGTVNTNNHLLTKDEKEFDDIMNFIRSNDDKNDLNNKRNEKLKKVKFDIDIEELEKFFLFMTKLSSLQIQVFNSTQPEIEKNLKMPIFFSSEFKNSLNHHQRLEVNNLKIMTLRRNKILKNPLSKIEVENLNYDALHAKNTQNNLSSIKNYFVVNKILRNWETTKKYANTQNLFENRNANIKRGNTINSHHTNDQKFLTTKINENIITDDFKIKNEINKNEFNKNEFNKNEINNLNKNDANLNKNDINNLNIKNLNFDEFKNTIRSYCKQHMPEKEETLDDTMLLYLSQKLSNDELQTLMENPEFVFEIIEEYQNEEEDENEDSLDKDSLDEDEMSVRIDEDASIENSFRSRAFSNLSKNNKKIEVNLPKIATNAPKIPGNLPKPPVPKVPFLNSLVKLDF